MTSIVSRPNGESMSKGDALLHKALIGANVALSRGIKKSPLQCRKDLIGKVAKDPWGLAFKIVTKRLVTRRKTPGMNNFDRVKYIVQSFFPHAEPFQRRASSSCIYAIVSKYGARRVPIHRVAEYVPIRENMNALPL